MTTWFPLLAYVGKVMLVLPSLSVPVAITAPPCRTTTLPETT